MLQAFAHPPTTRLTASQWPKELILILAEQAVEDFLHRWEKEG
jgi:hypothetical protein